MQGNISICFYFFEERREMPGPEEDTEKDGLLLLRFLLSFSPELKINIENLGSFIHFGSSSL